MIKKVIKDRIKTKKQLIDEREEMRMRAEVELKSKIDRVKSRN